MTDNTDALRCADTLLANLTKPSMADTGCAAAHIRRLVAENANLRTVMVAAAEEIHAHWDAHCDAEGYGPANLMRRLEEGIPAEYGYTAGRFAELASENQAHGAVMRQALEALYAVNVIEDFDQYESLSGEKLAPLVSAAITALRQSLGE